MVLLYQGQNTGGVSVLIGEIVALAGIFVFGRSKRAENTAAEPSPVTDMEIDTGQ